MKNRIIGALILLLIFIPLAYIGGEAFTCGMLVVGIFGLYELLSLRKETKKFPVLVELFAYLALILLVINQSDGGSLVLTLDYRILSFLIFAFFFPIAVISDNDNYNISDAFFLFGSVLFLGLSFHLIISIRNYSIHYFIFMFLITIITDTFAYISGSMVGRCKLCPNISPKKTIEGLIFGTIMGVIASSLYYVTVIDPTIDLLVLGIVTVTLSLVGQLGDLIFSSIKRYFNKKDFSNLIPGHGGILDRFDSVIFTSLAFVLFLSII